MKSKPARFFYTSAASSFLSERIDEKEEYTQATRVFQHIISRKRKAGVPIAKWQPLAPRCFRVKLREAIDLNFFYYFAVKTDAVLVFVFAIDFAVPPRREK
jgi:hypothetical protein